MTETEECLSWDEDTFDVNEVCEWRRRRRGDEEQCCCFSLFFFSLALSFSLCCLMRTSGERSELTHAPCSPAPSLPFHWQLNLSSLLSLVLSCEHSLSSLACVLFFISFPPFGFSLKNPHPALRHISTHANGTLSQSSLRCSVCSDCSHCWLYWICVWECVFH